MKKTFSNFANYPFTREMTLHAHYFRCGLLDILKTSWSMQLLEIQ